jgi:hypothetical protein
MEQRRFRALKRLVIIRLGLAALLVPSFIFASAGTIHYTEGYGNCLLGGVFQDDRELECCEGSADLQGL